MTETGTEIELKLVLEGEPEAERLRRVLGPRVAREEQLNVYFDDAAASWAACRWGARLRSTGGDEVILTVKGPASPVGEFVARGEWELALPGSERDPIAAGGAPLERALGRLVAERGARLPPELPRSLAPIGSIETVRDTYSLPGDDSLRVELDRSRYPDGSVAYELELELPDAHREPEARARLESTLAAAGVPWRPSARSKLARLREVVARGGPGGDAP